MGIQWGGGGIPEGVGLDILEISKPWGWVY